MITCYLRYEIDPGKIDDFERYAASWIRIVERYRGVHHGYFLPHESANDIAVALFSFPSLAAYERYRLDSTDDEECRGVYELANRSGCIRRYDRQFLRPLDRPAG